MRINRWAAAALFFSLGGLSVLGSGCTYTKNRINDFFDPISVGVGVGVGASARATHYVQLGAHFSFKQARLIGPKWLFPLWFVEGVGFSRRVEAPVGPGGEIGFAPIYHFRSIEMPDEKDASRVMILARTIVHTEKDPFWKAWYRSDIWSFFPSPYAYESYYDRRLFDFGLTFFGLELDFNPYELADFFLGLFTLDISGDDSPGEEVETAQAQAKQ